MRVEVVKSREKLKTLPTTRAFERLIGKLSSCMYLDRLVYFQVFYRIICFVLPAANRIALVD